MQVFRALRQRSFLFLWSGQTISSIGDFLYEITLAWWVLQTTGSALLMGSVLIAVLTPQVIFALIGGVAVDRLPRAYIMFASDLGRGLIVTIIAALALYGQLVLWHILVASILFGTVDAFFRPAYAAFVPEIMNLDDLPSANALTSISAQIGRIIGPLVGAGVIGLVGTGGAFICNALSFFISAMALVPLLQQSKKPERAAAAQGILSDIREGLQLVFRSPLLVTTILLSALTNITLAGPYGVAMPFLVKAHFGNNIAILGLLYAIFPIGYILGGIWVGRMVRIRWRGKMIYIGLMLAGLMLAIYGLPVPIWVLSVAALFNGAALEISNLSWITTLQEVVPDEQLGRVSSIDSLGSFALLPLGYALTGWAVEQTGATTVFLIGGLTTAICAICALAHPMIRKFD